MSKFPLDALNQLREDYETLNAKRLDMDNERSKIFESLIVNGIVTITSDKTNKFKTIRELSKNLEEIDEKMRKIDFQIFRIYQDLTR